MDLTVEELLASVKHRVKASGKELEVTLEEALKGYQREEDYTRKTMEVAERSKAVEAAQVVAEQHAQQMQTIAAQHGALLQQMEQALVQSYNAEDWNALRQNDPAEFAARDAEYKAQYQQLQQHKQYALQQMAAAQQQQDAYRQQVIVPQQQQLVRDAIPEWSDPKVADAERRQLAEYLINSNSYTPEEISGLDDHRAVIIARKAMLYDAQQAKAKETRTKVKDLPKVKDLKPGNRKSADAKRKAKRTDSLKRLRKTGSIHDAVAAMPDFD
jgi:hypothetical protein